MELNKIYNENCLDTMARMEDDFIDLTVTSPPYDNLRTYKGYSFDFDSIAKELFRITKKGGVVVWVVGDATIKGSESLTSFKQALYFKEIGFNVETMIFETSTYMPIQANRYDNNFQYMFILSKGKPKTFNPIMVKKSEKSLQRGKSGRDVSFRELDGKRQDKKPQKITTHKKKTNIWRFLTGFCSSSDNIASKHPAIFPEQLANDHILSWSNEGDLVYDCFMGSGTTAKMAILNNRNWIGSEISSEYCNIIEERIKKALEEKRKEKDLTQKTLFGDGM
jgi:site-specific DNA-methyltransferase (adenine-specific)